jgi:GNAT superfamily N-acetyltransferase
MYYENNGFSISTDPARLNVDYIHQFLSQTYWAENIPVSIVRKSIEGAICFGVYEGSKQIGFARVITDKATFAYLGDVFIDSAYRGLGLSKWLMEVIIAHPDLQGLRRFMLATRDAHGLYSQFGFTVITNGQNWMQIHTPDVYKK